MANSGAFCMFCGDSPCSCSGAPAKTVRKQKVEHAIVAPVAPSSPAAQAAQPRINPVVAYAIDVLIASGILDRDEVQRLRRDFVSTKSAELISRLEIWKRDHGKNKKTS